MSHNDAPRLLWLSSTRYSNPLPPNLARKWQALAQGLHRQIHVIGFAPGWRPQRFHESVTFHLMPQPGVPLLRYVIIFTWGTLLTLWLVGRQRCRTLIAQGPFEGAIGAAVKQITGLFGVRLSLCVESHNDFEEALFMQREIAAAGLYRRLMRAAARYALRHADALRPVSGSAAEQLRAYTPTTPQVQFMAWIDAEAFHQPRQQPTSASMEIVYAGVLIPRKGLHILLDAFARLDVPTATLSLAGPPDNPDYAAELRQQAQRLGLSERVHFLGSLSQAQLAGRLLQARALVLPSFSEGLPRVIVEAMFAGLPVVATAVSGVPEVLRTGETGWLVPPQDVDALTAALAEVYRVDIDTMSAAARQHAVAFFSSRAFVDGHAELLRLAESRTPPIPATD